MTKDPSEGARIPEKLLMLYARRFPVRKGKLRVIEGVWPAVIREQDTTRLARLRYGGFKLPCDLRENLQRDGKCARAG